MTGNPLSSSTNVSSPLQHIKRKFQSGRTEAYDLVKVKPNLCTLIIRVSFIAFI